MHCNNCGSCFALLTRTVRLLASAAILWACTAYTWAQEPPVAAGDKFQHVTVLHKMPADQMGKVMNIMSAALGVGCAHCHAGYDFAQEDIAKKAKARQMLSMTLALNEQHFGGQTVVTCMTCHQGRTIPLNAQLSATGLPLPISAVLAPTVALAADESKPTTDGTVAHIIDAYHRATKTDSEIVTADRQWDAVRVEPNGKEEPEMIRMSTAEGPGRTALHKWEQVTRYGQLAVTERYERSVAEKLAGDKKIELKSDEAEQIKIEAHLALGLDLTTLFGNWNVAPTVAIDQRRMRALKASSGELTHMFYFDEQSHLLRRRTASLPTVLGAYIIEVDYDDYQIKDGRRVPLKVVFNMPSVRWERRIKR